MVFENVWSLTIIFIFGKGENSYCTPTDQHARPGKTTPLIQSVWSMALSARQLSARDLYTYICIYIYMECMKYMTAAGSRAYTDITSTGGMGTWGLSHQHLMTNQYSHATENTPCTYPYLNQKAQVIVILFLTANAFVIELFC